MERRGKDRLMATVNLHEDDNIDKAGCEREGNERKRTDVRTG